MHEIMPSFEDGKAFRVSLHKTVLDAVVNHFHKMARSSWTDVRPSLVCRGSVEIIGNNTVASTDEAARHIATHTAQSDHPKLHKVGSIQPLGLTQRRRTVSNTSDPWM